MLTIDANGLRFACLAEGPEDGPLVLLVHGFPDTAHTWSHVLPRLAAMGFRAVAPFTRGYHPTAIPADGDYSVLTLGRDVLALVAALGREKAILVGHDWGSYAVYGAALLEPEKVSKLVTVAIPHPRSFRARHLTPGRAYRARHFLGLRLPGTARRLRRDGFAALETIYRRWSPTWDLPASELSSIKECFAAPGALEAALGYYHAIPLLGVDRKLFEKIAMPSLTVYGEDDGVADRALFEIAREGFAAPHTLVPIPHAGHFLHREQPELFWNALSAFLK